MKTNEIKTNSIYIYCEDIGSSLVTFNCQVLSKGKGNINILIGSPFGNKKRKIYPYTPFGDYRLYNNIDELLQSTNKIISKYFDLCQ